MITLGMHTDNWRCLSQGFDAAIEKTLTLGLSHIEFGAIHGHYFIHALGYEPSVSLAANPRALRRMLDRKGLQVSQIDGGYPFMGPQGAAYGISYVQQCIRFAAELGCPMVDTTDGATAVPGMTPDEVLRFTIENYRQCLSWAEDYGVIINVEPHGPYTNSAEFMLKLFKHFDSEYLRCNFDTGNAFIAGHDPVEYFKTLQPYVSHLHIKDVSPELAAAVRGEETGIGNSVVPIGGGVNAENIKAIFKLLIAAGWDGTGSIETFGSDDNLRASIDFCRAAIAVPD